MHPTLGELAEQLDAKLEGDASCQISGIAPLHLAQADEIGFVSSNKYLSELDTTQAGAVILHPNAVGTYKGNLLLVDNPYLAFAKISRLFYPDKQMLAGIHSTASIADSAALHPSVSIAAHASVGEHVVLEEGVSLGAGSVVADGCTLGKQTQILANATILENTIIGENCVLHAGCVIGDDGFGYANEKGKWLKIPQVGRVVLGNEVEIGSNTTIDCGALGDTVIEDGVKLDNQIHVAHNVRIGAHTAIAAGVAIAGSATIGKYCTVAGMAGIEGHITIADKTHISAMCTVSKSIEETGGVYSGAWPAQANRPWGKMVAQVRRLPKLMARVKDLEEKLKDK